MMLKSGNTTRKKQQEINPLDNPDIMSTEEDAAEFAKLLNKEKLQIMNDHASKRIQ